MQRTQSRRVFPDCVLKMLDVLDTRDNSYECRPQNLWIFPTRNFCIKVCSYVNLSGRDGCSTYFWKCYCDAETFICCREHLHLLAKFRQKVQVILFIIPLFFVVQLALFLLFVSNWNTLNSLDWILNFIATANFVVPVMWIALFLYLSCSADFRSNPI